MIILKQPTYIILTALIYNIYNTLLCTFCQEKSFNFFELNAATARIYIAAA